MLKELRDLVSFILGFVNDVVELVSTSRLSMSPTLTIGRERAIALQVSGIIGIILVTMFLRTWTAVPPKIELLPFSVVTILYFAAVSFLIGLVVRWQSASADHARKDRELSDKQTDAYSYVIGFNLVALVVFAVIRDGLNYLFSDQVSLLPAVAAAIIAGALTVIFGRGGRLSNSNLTVGQKAIVSFLLATSFFLYTATIVGAAA